MRRLLASLLLIGALLSGCAAGPVTGMANVEGGPAQELKVPARELEYRLELETFQDVAHADSGEALASYRVKIPVMTVWTQEGEPMEKPKTDAERAALAAAEAFNLEFSTWSSGEHFEQAAADAQTSLDIRKEEGADWFDGYSMELTCAVYETDRIVSVYGPCYSYTGGAHPNTVMMSWNFDLESGTFFNGELLAADRPSFRQQVEEELLRQIQERPDTDGMSAAELLWPEYETILKDWTSYTVFFDETGMTVAFSPYELAPYAAGEQIFTMPYDWLESRLGQHGCELLGLPGTSETES